MRRDARIAVASIVLAALLAVAGALYVADRYQRPGPLASATSIIVPKGAAVPQIAQLLEAADVITEPLIFRLGARLEGLDASLRAGEYRFPPAVSMQQALAMLRQGDTVVRRVTVPEGMMSRQVVSLLAEAEGLEGELAAVPLEGALLPETYGYSWGDSRSDMIRRMSSAMSTTLDELWANRAEGLPLASPREAVILASIVEKETGVPEERPRVAAVFINRLRLGMKLQADPTVSYAVYGASAPPRPLTFADLQHPSPYNTYLVEALPPGPIANPGRASLQAVLRPVQSDELFFVADGSGGHVFARTLDEHNRNVARWRKLNEE
jgi:peptidoglycan lytic transglycosylase G